MRAGDDREHARIHDAQIRRPIDGQRAIDHAAEVAAHHGCCAGSVEFGAGADAQDAVEVGGGGVEGDVGE